MKTRPVSSTTYGVGKDTGRRAVYSRVYALQTAWLPRAMLGDTWSDEIRMLHDEFMAEAESALAEHGGVEKTTWDMVAKASWTTEGPMEGRWDFYQAGYKDAAISRREIASQMREIGDKEIYTAVLTGEAETVGSEPLRAIPQRVEFRAMSRENTGHALTSLHKRPLTEYYGREAAKLHTPVKRERVKRAPPVVGSKAAIRAAWREGMTNDEAYKLFPDVPKPSARQTLNKLRKPVSK